MPLKDFFPQSSKTVRDMRREPAWWEFVLAAPLLALWIIFWTVIVAILAVGALGEVIGDTIGRWWDERTTGQKKLLVATVAFGVFLLMSGCSSAVKWTMEDRDRMAAQAIREGADYRVIANDLDSFERLFSGYPELKGKD